ncbi:MAG: YeeE/YedE family protein [Methylococcales bacterium]|nr:YeeE/YedE family protein [Methylococcales bacterium]
MKNFIYQRQWGWLASGITLGLAFLLAVAFVKPVGVSTQFVILDGIVWDIFSDDVTIESSTSKTGYSSTNAYLNKGGGKYAKNIANPLNYSFIFVLAMVAGGFVGSKLQSDKVEKNEIYFIPKIWEKRFGSSLNKRYLATFLGGILVLFGARLAGGCTSGHMMSGIMQTSLSGYLFALGAFATAVPVAIMMYNKEE